MRSIRLATRADLADVLDLLNAAASWLHHRGLDQWPDGFDEQRIGPMVDQGEVWVVHDDGQAVATVTISPDGDPDFWSPAELAAPAHYIAKLAISRDHAGHGLGALLLRWTVDHAAREGMKWARLDAWKTNPGLHDFYARAGWTYLRTADLPHRRSGTLFQRPAHSDPEAYAAFG